MPRRTLKDPSFNGDTTIPVEDLAEWLCLTPRRVQQLEKKGIVHKDSHGAYQLKPSVMGYIREMNSKADGKNSEYHKERTKLMKLKRQDGELNYFERAGKLVSAEAIGHVIEKAKSAEKQQVLFMPKQLAPRLEGDPAVNEAVLEEWAYQFLKGQTEINITADLALVPAPDPDMMPELQNKKRERKKK